MTAKHRTAPTDYGPEHWQVVPFDNYPTADQLNKAAKRIGIPADGVTIASWIAAIVEANGIKSGRELVDDIKAKETPELGRGNADWTKFFKYACKHHGLIRLKRGRLKPGAKRDSRRVAFATRQKAQALGFPIT